MTIRSVRSAMAFLTVLPAASAKGEPGERLGRAYFPAIGALTGLASGVVFVVAGALFSPWLAAVAAVATMAVLTGALHLDGLADAADGLLGGGDTARRLEVMRDPRLGSFGTTTIVLVLLGEVTAISSMSPARGLAGLAIAGALSRLAMLAVIALVPYVRPTGLGVAAFDPAHRGFDLALGGAIAAIVCVIDWRRALVALPLVALTTYLVVALARRRLGGATGDICGATAELSLLATLVVFAARP